MPKRITAGWRLARFEGVTARAHSERSGAKAVRPKDGVKSRAMECAEQLWQRLL